MSFLSKVLITTQHFGIESIWSQMSHKHEEYQDTKQILRLQAETFVASLGLFLSLVPRLSPRPDKNRKGGGEPGIHSYVIPWHTHN